MNRVLGASLLAWLLVGFFLLSAAPAAADSLLYAEGVDLSNDNSSPTNLGSFVDGVNIIRGSISDVDSFDFWHAALTAGKSITSILYSVSSLTQGFTANMEVFDVAAIGNTAPSTDIYAATPSADILLALLPAVVGAYPLPGSAIVKGATSLQVAGGSYDWEFRITVESASTSGGSPVPEPFTAGLVALGGALLAWRARLGPGKRSHAGV